MISAFHLHILKNWRPPPPVRGSSIREQARYQEWKTLADTDTDGRRPGERQI